MSETGIKSDNTTIHNEHAVQIKLLRAVEEGVAGDLGSGELAELVTQLFEYTKVHFLSEQLLMRMHGYPDYQEHQQHHDELLARIGDLYALLHGQDRQDAATLATSLREWVLGHIGHDDSAFSRYLEQELEGKSS